MALAFGSVQAEPFSFSSISVDLTYTPVLIASDRWWDPSFVPHPFGLQELPGVLSASAVVYGGSGESWSGDLLLSTFSITNFHTGIAEADAPYVQFRQPEIYIDFSAGTEGGRLERFTAFMNDDPGRTVYFSQYGLDVLVYDRGWNGYISYALSDAKISVASIPEPETYAMLLAGLGLLGLTAKRRRQKLNA
jgi:hypothetical protein